MSEEWEKIEEDKVKELLIEINDFIEPVPFNIDMTSIRIQKLSFYKEYDFYELTDLSVVPGVKKYAIYKKGDVHVVNWTNQIMYDVNDKAPIILNKDNVASYVRFFFNYVRGRHGRFLIVDSVDDITWQSEPPPQGRKVIQDMILPVKLIDNDDDNDDDDTYNLEAYMIFKDSLFKTMVHVTKDGMVSLSEEDLKIEGMPISPDNLQNLT